MKKLNLAPLIVISAFASVHAQSVFWRNTELPVANFFDENAWIYQGTTTAGVPTSADSVRLGSESGFETTFSGEIELRELRQYGGETFFTGTSGTETPSSFTATYRVYMHGGVSNIYSYGDTPYTFTSNDAFILGDESSSYSKEDLTLNIYGNALVEGKNWGLCFGEAAQKYAVSVNVFDDAVVKGKLLVGSKTLAENAKTKVVFSGNSKGQFSGIQMRENSTLIVSGNAALANTAGDVNFYNEILDSSSKPLVRFSDSGSLTANYKVYQYNSDVELSGQSNITAAAYYLGTRVEDASIATSDTLRILDNASIVATNQFGAYSNSHLSISGEGASLSAKTAYLDNSTIDASAAAKDGAANVSVSDVFYIYNSGSFKLSNGNASLNVLSLGYDGANESGANLNISKNAKFASNKLYAYSDAKVLVDSANFEVLSQSKSNGIVLYGANELILQNGATADLDRFAMYNENAKVELRGSDLKVSAWCIGGDKVEDPDYSLQTGTIAFVADAYGISSIESMYIDYNFNILLDFRNFALQGNSSFEILTITSQYFDMVKNWVSDADKLIDVLKANDADSYIISLSDDGHTLNISYNHVIPEPSAFAAIFGVASLVIAAFRRRK